MSGRKRAVIIGVNEYRDKKINPLSGAVNDATELRDLLKERGEFDIDDERDFLIDKAATSERIRKAVSDLFWKMDECEIALFYFAGHGRRDHLDNGFLLPHDAIHDEPFVHGIDILELKRLFQKAPVNIKSTGLLILDCCYSGIATETEGSRSPGGDKEAVQSFYSALDLESGGSGRYILASADADKTARELEQEHACDKKKHVHGQFSFHLIEGLQARAKDHTGRVSLGRLVTHLGSAFPTNAKNRPQLAVGSGIGMDSIFLVKVAEETEKYIRSRVGEVEELLKNDDAQSTINAVRALAELNKLSLWDDSIEFYREEARRKIEEVRGIFFSWWMRNGVRIPRTCSYSQWHGLLKKAAYELCYDILVTFDDMKFTFLTDCVEFMERGKSAQDVGAFISLWEKDCQPSVSVGGGETFQRAKSSTGQASGALTLEGPVS